VNGLGGEGFCSIGDILGDLVVSFVYTCIYYVSFEFYIYNIRLLSFPNVTSQLERRGDFRFHNLPPWCVLEVCIARMGLCVYVVCVYGGELS
jgi:hypothetical protein